MVAMLLREWCGGVGIGVRSYVRSLVGRKRRDVVMREERVEKGGESACRLMAADCVVGRL
jgi:hypothetical protein